ncbi:MAG TPA: PspC domain-containing protein [Acidimicrobiales bacterium]|nr:PspC domain-containing protein [Acidimicrobiales bacterium]
MSPSTSSWPPPDAGTAGDGSPPHGTSPGDSSPNGAAPPTGADPPPADQGQPRRAWWRAPRLPGPLRRSTTDRVAGGVAGGLASRLGIDAKALRVLFVVLAVGGGTGLAVYVVAWLAIPRQGAPESILRRVLSDRHTVALAAAFASVIIAALLVLTALGLTFTANLVWPVSIAAGGLVLVWRGADDDERAFLDELMGQAPLIASRDRRTRRSTVARVALGAVLVAVGLSGLVTAGRPTYTVIETVIAANVVIVGFLVAFGPWWLRLARDLATERRERVRTEERAHMAAAVHDSVLQTLALIQRAAGDQREVTRLARAQERELRAWLFEGRSPGSFHESEVTTVAEAVAVIERDVEADHKVPVDAVIVGDCPLTDDLRALMAAGREATVNAAAWSGAPSVSLFVEVEAQSVSLYVRDRGRGFDPGAVRGERRGISQSIRARMERHGGSAVIRSTPGQGTEVALVMPRSAPAPP